ncbi:hypothetical protein ACUHMQ_16685 [Chitinimonas sp. PSY-7]|uniref:hypothetical protein n=1 Tax=Chitinimonas sp. PSY-7 TaxID=3459088 RepID=UPI00403FEA92
MPSTEALALVSRLKKAAIPANHTSNDARGVRWTISLRTSLGSNEQIACGVAVLVLNGNGYPSGKILSRFADLEPLRTQFSALAFKELVRVVATAQHSLNNNDARNPVPSMLVYGPEMEWHYPTPEKALDSLVTNHISFLRGPEEKFLQAGGHISPIPPFQVIYEGLDGLAEGMQFCQEQDRFYIIYNGRLAMVLDTRHERFTPAEAVKLGLLDLVMRSDGQLATAAFIVGNHEPKLKELIVRLGKQLNLETHISSVTESQAEILRFLQAA